MIGQIIGNYKIEERMQSKELYTIYLAKDINFNDRAYLKILSHKITDNADVKKEYLNQADRYLKLTHPNILKFLKTGEEAGYTYLAYEIFTFKNLHNYIAEHANLTLKDKLDIFFRVCVAVDYAHQHMMLHKNITASNVLIDDNKNIKLADFGISYIELLQTEINANQILEDFYYFSPEKIQKETLDEKSDIYSLGILLFYILTKSYPFEVADLEGLFRQKTEGRVKDLSSYDPSSSSALSGILKKLLNKNRADRYINVRDILEDINKSALGVEYKINISPKQANWFINKAREAYLAGQINSAIENWEKAAEFDPFNSNIFANLARIYAESANLEKTIENYKCAMQISPFNNKWRVELAGLHKKNKQYEAALIEYDLVKKLDKDFKDFYFNYGNCLFFQQKYDEAAGVWEEGLKISSDKARFFYNIGVAKYLRNKTDEAVKYWGEVLKINDKFVKAIYNLSIVETTKNNIDKALQYWNEVDKISGIAEIKVNLGNNNYISGNASLAQEYWNSALALNPDLWQPHFNFGVYYFEGDINKAKEAFERALNLNDSCWQAAWNLGCICRKSNDINCAEEYFNKVLRLKPNYWQANYYLGEKLIKDGRFEEAQKYFSNITESADCASESFNKNMGMIFYKNGLMDKAVDCWARSTAHQNFEWGAEAAGEIPKSVYEASKILVEKDLKEKGEESSFFVREDPQFSLKPELALAECRDINGIIDY